MVPLEGGVQVGEELNIDMTQQCLPSASAVSSRGTVFCTLKITVILGEFQAPLGAGKPGYCIDQNFPKCKALSEYITSWQQVSTEQYS